MNFSFFLISHPFSIRSYPLIKTNYKGYQHSTIKLLLAIAISHPISPRKESTNSKQRWKQTYVDIHPLQNATEAYTTGPITFIDKHQSITVPYAPKQITSILLNWNAVFDLVSPFLQSFLYFLLYDDVPTYVNGVKLYSVVFDLRKKIHVFRDCKLTHGDFVDIQNQETCYSTANVNAYKPTYFQASMWTS